MLTEELIKVEVTETDIIQANEDYCPLTNAIANTLRVDVEQVGANSRRVIIFDDYDVKRAVYSYGEGEEIVKSFLDSWCRHLCGCDESLSKFKFEYLSYSYTNFA